MGDANELKHMVLYSHAWLVTRTVHVELVSDLSTSRFLMALRRFISLYGTPLFIRSDNGRNFVGAARELTAMLKRWEKDAEDISLRVLLRNTP